MESEKRMVDFIDSFFSYKEVAGSQFLSLLLRADDEPSEALLDSRSLCQARPKSKQRTGLEEEGKELASQLLERAMKLVDF